MKKNLFILSAVLISGLAYTQVGVNSATPKSTFDVTAKNTDGSTAEGIIAPRLTGDQVKAGDAQYTSAQTGNLLYATSAVTTIVAGSKTENITAAGYYYFDGLKWQKIGGSAAGNFWSTTGNGGTDSSVNFLGTTDNKDLIFRRNNIRAGFLNDKSTAFGQGALNTLSTGDFNAAFGVSTLASNTTGRYNVAVGAEALTSNTTGSDNFAMGVAALSNNTTGTRNTAIGTFALFANIIGGSNTAVGTWALQNNTGSTNTAIGTEALFQNTSGGSNAAIGYWAGRQNTTGSFNLAIGHSALRDNSIGNNNTAVGYNAFRFTKGTGNTALGYQAGDNVDGSGNVLIGNQAGAAASVINNRLMIANSNTNTPLIDGDFAAQTLTINGSLASTTLSSTATATTGNRSVVADATGKLMIGNAILRGSGNLSTGLIDTGNTTEVTFTLAGATVNSVVSISPRTALTSGIVIAYVRVSAANTIAVGLQNNVGSGSSISLPATVFDVVVL